MEIKLEDMLEQLSKEVEITKRELALTALASLMTGVVLGMLAARPKHRPPMMPPCPQPRHRREKHKREQEYA